MKYTLRKFQSHKQNKRDRKSRIIERIKIRINPPPHPIRTSKKDER